MQSCDKFQEDHATVYLHVFNIFVKCIHRWFNILIKLESTKPKLQKEQEMEEFKISNINYSDNFSDSVLNKTAEEMYKEDMNKSKDELENEIEDGG